MSESKVIVFSEDVDFVYNDLSLLEKWITSALDSEHREFSNISIIFCSDMFLLKLNQDYLNHDYFTDILTFQMGDDPIEGELYISIDRIIENAKDLNLSWKAELHRVIIHGVMHLAGYGDKTASEISLMRNKEDHYLSKLDHSENV